MSLKEDILRAARADSIPAGESGTWSVRKWAIDRPRIGYSADRSRSGVIPAGSYTSLVKLTMATMHNADPGECVMLDAPHELRTHLDFMMRAKGRVLKTGLGLGCVVRGCLVNPAVTHVTVIERDPHVLKLVAPHMPKDRVEIIQADAIQWCKETDRQFDSAWHDIWNDDDLNEPPLAVLHGDLLCATSKKVKGPHGAWDFPRFMRKEFGLV